MAKSKIDRYEGAMLGVAVGDALGAPLEFMDAAEIQRKHGTVREMIGGGWLHVEPGEVTDDTQMTLAVAEGIASGADYVERVVGLNFLRWYETNPKDIGGTCRSVISMMSMNPGDFTDWLKASERVHRQTNGWTAGNGALMRTVYPALYYGDINRAVEVAGNIGTMTHWHYDSRDAVREYVRMLHTIANSDMTAEQAVDWMKLWCKTSDTMKQAIMKTNRGPLQPEPTGYSIDSLVYAVNAIRDTGNFEDAVACAVYRGGDADTIGAITGGLAGAIYGASEIPLRWINALANEPNRKTVQLFHTSAGVSQEGHANTLAIRLLDLAHIAYQQGEQAK